MSVVVLCCVGTISVGPIIVVSKNHYCQLYLLDSVVSVTSDDPAGSMNT